MTDEYSLPVVFHFDVKMGNDSISFQEVKGLEYQIETLDVVSGGDNSTVYSLPKRMKFSDLVLCRALDKVNETFYSWCKKHLDTPNGFLNIELKDFQIILQGMKSIDAKPGSEMQTVPLASWSVKGAYPYKWTLSSLDAMKNEIAIESVSLKVHSISREL